jgi:hypothetical protein
MSRQTIAAARERFRDAWTAQVDENGKFHSSRLLAVLQTLRCFSTTINVGKKEKPRMVTYHGVPNDALHLLKSLGYSDHEIANGVFLDYTTLETWYVNRVSSKQVQKGARLFGAPRSRPQNVKPPVAATFRFAPRARQQPSPRSLAIPWCC